MSPEAVIRQAWCLHFGTPGDHFGTLGTPWGPWWEQQKELLGARGWISIDFDLISERHFESFSDGLHTFHENFGDFRLINEMNWLIHCVSQLLDGIIS